MTHTPFRERSCRQIRARIDAYLNSELQAAENVQMHHHFQQCGDCCQEVEARRTVGRRLQAAVRATPVPEEMEERIRKSLQPVRRSYRPGLTIMAIAAAVALCFAGWMAGPGAYPALASSRVASLVRWSLGGHIRCAMLGKSNLPVAAEELSGERLPLEFRGLLPAIQQDIPAGSKLIKAHECHYLGRAFAHLTFERDSHLVSLVITRKGDGEVLKSSDLKPTLMHSGIPIYEAGVQQFEISSFETRDHLIYTISDLPHIGNLDFMVSLATPLLKFFHQIEG